MQALKKRSKRYKAKRKKSQQRYEESRGGKKRKKKYEESRGGKKRKKKYEESRGGKKTKKKYEESRGGEKRKKKYEESRGGKNKRKEYEESRHGKNTRKEYENLHDRRAQTYRYMKAARECNIYKALHHRFARYAATDLAERGAGHVRKEETAVVDELSILEDKDLVKIRNRWEKYCKRSVNRSVCATCGIIGLTNAKKFRLEERAIQAFEVCLDTLQILC